MQQQSNLSLRVLLIEDSEDDAELVLRELRRGGFKPSYSRVDTHEAMDKALSHDDWDIILSDYHMPQFSALDALQLAQKRGVDLPFIVISGAIGEETAVEAMRAGAQDYLMKDNLKRLVPAVQRELREAGERQARRVAEETVRLQAFYDPLTSLPNRVLFIDRLRQAIAYAHRSKSQLALLFLDLDRFKNINDTLGHTVGDRLLYTASERLSGLMREGDTLARLSGDEFVLLGMDRGHENAINIATRVLEELERPFEAVGQELHLAASIGIAVFPEHGSDSDTLLKNAEASMYHAKSLGGSRYQFFTNEIDAASSRRLTVENNLRRALRQDEFRVYYQPQVDLHSGNITGVEALVRWQDPDLGLLEPGQFIQVAEDTGLIVPMGLWVLRQACHDLHQWQSPGSAPLRLAVNLSVRQLLQPDLLDVVQETLDDTGVDGSLLELEITESGIMQDPEWAVDTLRRLKGMGLQIAIDDFGTGYSSLAYLKRFPIDVLKIDRSFVRDIEQDPDDAAIVAAIVALARNLHLRVVAEGVESRAQAGFLRDHGCDHGQGYLFSRPLPQQKLLRFLQQQRQTSHLAQS